MNTLRITLSTNAPISADSIDYIVSDLASEYLEDGDEIEVTAWSDGVPLDGEPGIWFTYEETPID